MWNTGAGEMGNWGVHVLDDVRNNVFLDKVTMPAKLHGVGSRVLWNDAGETPNVHLAHFDAGGVPVLVALCNIGRSPGSSKAPERPGPGSGYVAYCEGGRLEGQRGSAVAYDTAGKQIKKFKGTGGNGIHQQNFIDAMRSRDPKILHAPADVGLYSTGWCHLANIACLVGKSIPADQLASVKSDSEACAELKEEFERILAANKVSKDKLRVSPPITFDPKSEQFTGDHADAANPHLRREFRKPFVVPDIAAGAASQAAS
jgi:hypothetical protein